MFTYMSSWFFMLNHVKVNIPFPWILWDCLENGLDIDGAVDGVGKLLEKGLISIGNGWFSEILLEKDMVNS